MVLLATNPVDILTHLAVRWSSRPAGRIFGSGTTLDSARFRALIGSALDVSPRSVHAYVLGEHGDSQVPVWSHAALGGVPVALEAEERKRIEDTTRNAAREIIARKGHTDLAIGVVIAHLVHAVLTDERGVHPLSVPLEGRYGIGDVAMSVPCVLGQHGIVRRLAPELPPHEVAALHASAEVLRAATRDAGLA